MNEVSMYRKGSSLRVGHGVERRVSEEVFLSFWRGKDGEEEEEDEGSESSRVSANWRTKGSEKLGCRVREDRIGNLGLDFGALGVPNCGILGL